MKRTIRFWIFLDHQHDKKKLGPLHIGGCKFSFCSVDMMELELDIRHVMCVQK